MIDNMKLLYRNRAKIDSSNNEELHTLHIACTNNTNVEAIQFILENCPDLDINMERGGKMVLGRQGEGLVRVHI